MFQFYNQNVRIGVYLDYSNMHYTKYNLWRDYDITQFINECLNDTRITLIAMYWAYDPTSPWQYNWTQRLQTNFSTPRNRFFFKKIEMKGDKYKWNVDTEMWFDISQDLSDNLRDVAILFSWDGDFLYPIQKLISANKKVTVISTKWHIAKELISYINTLDDNICRYINIHTENQNTIPIRLALRDNHRGLCIHPTLLNYIQNSDTQQKEELRDWAREVINNNVQYAEQPEFIKENPLIKKIIIRWHLPEKQAFISYLENLI